MRWSRTLTTLLLLSLQPGFFVQADDDDHLQARRLVESGAILPLAQILESVRERWSGRIIEVELETEQGRHIYEIELLDPQGRVWELKFDAVSGRLLKTEEED